MRGKLIVIEGTDCSGKETQSNLLIEKLTNDGEKVIKWQFPRYDTPTGKIIGGPYLGKETICDSYFEEGPTNVPPKVASLYYAADRLYNSEVILEKLNEGVNVILDRYVESNMGYQGAKFETKEERAECFKFLNELEYGLLKLPKPDLVVFLHMPYEAACELKKDRNEVPDGHEKDANHLKRAEQTYLELKDLYDFSYIKCTDENENIRSIDNISEDVYNVVRKMLNDK